jgi:hypothetical protein
LAAAPEPNRFGEGVDAEQEGDRRERAAQVDEDTKDELACTLVGYSSGVGVRMQDVRRALPRDAAVQLCAGPSCVSGRLGRGPVAQAVSRWRGVPKHPDATYTADVTVLDRRGRVLLHLRQAVRVHKFEPNGHACGPTCWFAGLRLDAARRRLVPVRS